MNIILGYLLVIFYLLVLIFGVGLLAKKYFGVEISRKIIHILSFLVFPIYDYFIGPDYHLIVICFLFLGVVTVSYFFKILAPIERKNNKNPGTIYYASSLLVMSILAYFFKELYYFVPLAFIALSFGDGFAGIIGTEFGKKKIYKNKSYAGFIACVTVSFVAMLLMVRTYNINLSVIAVLLLALFVGIIELVDIGLDNLLIPLFVFGLGYLLSKDNGNLLIALLIFDGVFLVSYLLNIMKFYGTLLSSFIGATFYYIGGIYSFLFVIGLYVVLLAVHLIRKKAKFVDVVTKKTGAKDVVQVIANGGFSLVFLFMALFLKQDIYILMALLVMLAAFSDSIASDIGTLSKGKVYDVFKGKETVNGLSGGVTILGTVSMAIFSFAFSYLATLITKVDFIATFILWGICILSVSFDTFLGSVAQAKFKCEKCGLILEKEVHCDTPTTLVSGVKWLNNDLVNLFSSLLTFGLSFILLVITL